MKKLEIEKTKPTFIISTFKTDIIKVGLVFSISNFFIAKMSLANNWRSFSSSYLALVHVRKLKYYNFLVPKAGCYVVIVLSAQTILNNIGSKELYYLTLSYLYLFLSVD